MTNGWLVFAPMVGIVLCSGFILAIAILRAAWAQREREALTSTDLRALEESAVYLIEELKSEADRGSAELDKRCIELSELIAQADIKLAELKAAMPQGLLPLTHEPTAVSRSTDRRRILELASSGLDCSGIAKATGLDCAEVKLVLSLSKLQ
jgi:hypothetical protein